jgi:hypothetical protein
MNIKCEGLNPVPYLAKDDLVANCHRFPWDYANRFSCVKDRHQFDKKLISLFKDLHDGAFWCVLGEIDGFPKETPVEQEATRAWAKKTFVNFELDELFNLSAATALTMPFGETGCPGRKRGHSYLYKFIIEKPNSMFRNKFNDEQVKILQNGRFWEQIPEMGRGQYGTPVVEDVLLNHYEDLSLDFVPKGIEIFLRNYGISLASWQPDLSPEAFDRFTRFFDSVYIKREELGVEKQILDNIFEKIIFTSVHTRPGNDWDENWDGIMPPKGKTFDLLKAQFNLPSIKAYLDQKSFQKSFSDWLCQQKNAYGYVGTIFIALPLSAAIAIYKLNAGSFKDKKLRLATVVNQTVSTV